MRRFCSILFIATVVLVGRAAEPQSLSTLPQATAAHFCQLLVRDNTGTVQSLNNFIRRSVFVTTDSLTAAQSFCTYIFNYGGWESLCIFPHATTDNITWHAAEDRLPADIDSEHQKYIHEVFPRLIAEIEAENWTVVDAYIDRMLEYQTTFASLQTPQTSHATPSAALLFLPFVFFLALPFFCAIFFHLFGNLRKTPYICRRIEKQM